MLKTTINNSVHAAMPIRKLADPRATEAVRPSAPARRPGRDSSGVLEIEGANDRDSSTLDALPIGVEAVVRSVGGDRSVARRLMEMGLLPGTRVSILRVAPLADPLELRVRCYSLSIRRAEARAVRVERV